MSQALNIRGKVCVIEAVAAENLSAAAHVHAVSWRESHRAICAPAFVAAHDDARQEAYIREAMAAGKRFFLLRAEEPAGVVAAAGGVISDLYVLPEQQGQGYGSALLDFALSRCAGAARLTVLSSNQRARAMYRRRGFRESGRTIALKNELYEIEMLYEPNKED